jgi:predicted DNA-binding transcriptional regulator AlpA
MDKRTLTEQEAAQYIGMSRSFLRQHRMNGARNKRTIAPGHIRVGTRTIRYLIEELDAWLDENKVRHRYLTEVPVESSDSHIT